MKEDLIVLLKKIDALKSEIESMRPLPPEREGRIFQKLRLDWNFHSNAIEGNSLTYGETNAFLMEGLTAKGKPLKDHLDLKGHNEAIDFLRHFIDKNEEITERDIRELHKMILVEPYKSKAISPGGQPSEKTIQIGQYKTQPNHVQTATGEMFYFASPEETPAKMHDLMERYRANRGTIHPVELAALFHYDFVRIHPFDDGNGRMSRLLMNFILMQFGFPPVVIKTSKKAEYFYALRSADVGDKDVFVEYVGEQLVHSMEIYLRGARGEDISEADDLDKDLALFIKSYEKADLSKIRLDNKKWSRIFAKQLVQLIISVHKRGHGISGLFISNFIKIWAKNSNIETIGPAIFNPHSINWNQLYEILDKPHLIQFGVEFNYEGFKKSIPPIDTFKNLFIDFDEYSFTVSVSNNPNKKIEVGYGVELTLKQLNSIEIYFLNELMEEIKQKTQKQ